MKRVNYSLFQMHLEFFWRVYCFFISDKYFFPVTPEEGIENRYWPGMN